jgi:CRP-like cAMP-binding protein
MSAVEHKRKRALLPDEDPRLANRLLSRLSPSEYARLAGDLEAVPLEFKETLYEQGDRITEIYFPTSGVVSLITVMTEGGEPTENGTVGREGMVGLPVVLEADVSPGRALCQIAGTALRMPVERFVLCVKRIETLRTLLLRYAHVAMVMVGQAAACNRSHETKARMARWLLMMHDRVDGDEFPLTQEFLAQMVGVRRPAVSVAGTALQRDGLIRYTRGKITVRDRAGLEQTACECYAHIQDEFVRYLGPP